MREISVSIDVFAAIWALRRAGEQTENDILKRILGNFPGLDDEQRDSIKAHVSESAQDLGAVHFKHVDDGTKEGKGSRSTTLDGRSEREAGMGKVRWVDDVYLVLSELGGRASLHDIYKHVAAKRRAAGRSVPRTLEATIRRTIEDHSLDSDNFRGVDLFAKVGRGEWAIRAR